MALGLAVEVNGVELVDDLAQQLAALHVVEGVFKHAAHHVAARVALCIPGNGLEPGEELAVHKLQQGVTGDAFSVRCPVAPAQGLGDGALVAVSGQFKFFLLRVKHLQEQQPGELGDALGIAIHAAVLAHDVLDGFDDGRDVGHAGVLTLKKWAMQSGGNTARSPAA